MLIRHHQGRRRTTATALLTTALLILGLLTAPAATHAADPAQPEPAVLQERDDRTIVQLPNRM
ncbi:MAG: hypothetical protein WD534_05730, partial [Phycisphaeraceae bacterium]